MAAGEALVGHRVYWEPYVSGDESILVDVTGLTGTALLKATRIPGTIADANRMAEAGKGKHPFHDPRLGCLRYTSN